MNPDLRRRMGEAAVRIGKVISYRGAGTVEFILDPELNFYFLEVNTRLQVEHPITEMVVGLDLVQAQINIAMGFSLKELNLSQDSISMKGHAIEVRLYAEDPTKNFFPSPGPIVLWKEAIQSGIRYDTGIETGSEISIHYDPMISKIIAYGETRALAIQRLKRALRETVIFGLKTNKTFLISLLSHPKFLAGDFSTHFIHTHLNELLQGTGEAETDGGVAAEGVEGMEEFLVGAFLFDWRNRNQRRVQLMHLPSGWRNNKYKNSSVIFVTKESKKSCEVEYSFLPQWSRGHNHQQHQSFHFEVKILGKIFNVVLLENREDDSSVCVCHINGAVRRFVVVEQPNENQTLLHLHCNGLGEISLFKKSKLDSDVGGKGAKGETSESFVAPMPGKILKVLVTEGDKVKLGDLVMVMESMKMENKIYAQRDGSVQLSVSAGDLIQEGKILFSVV
eukprot:TRINITY_DN7301_c0_g1_i1.p1 TRINITY_DN7301_c0_g1~~TRINITY_DN7301_c0_g1_i1.p1  ORF type:complete len:449 (+),score=134.23 TRINITY_DN7301_c0_g1_i1:855-2201(+)